MLILLALLPHVLGFSLMLGGDVNLNPVNVSAALGFEYVWGTMLPVLHSADVLAFNHESTLAGIALSDPNVIQFEDPLHYVDTYKAVGVDLIMQANNHEFDFGVEGAENTVAALTKLGIAWTGVGETMEQVTAPKVISGPDGTPMAFFSVVIDECWRWPNGTFYYDGCTCGANAGPPPSYQCYQAGADTMPLGLWYYWSPSISDEVTHNISTIVAAYKRANPSHLVVVYLHAGPNFQWKPYPEHEKLLRTLSDSCDLVWGTSSHHIQRFEVLDNGVPILYGSGDLLFRHEVGVVDFCPVYAVPCESYRPDLALNYKFEIVKGSDGNPKVDLNSMLAFPSKHTDTQTFLVTDSNDIHWMQEIFNEVSNGATASYNATIGGFQINVAHP